MTEYDRVPRIAYDCSRCGIVAGPSPFGAATFVGCNGICPNCHLPAAIIDGAHTTDGTYEALRSFAAFPPVLVKRLQKAKRNIEAGNGYDEETLAAIEAASPALGWIARKHGNNQVAQAIILAILTFLIGHAILDPFTDAAADHKNQLLVQEQMQAMRDAAAGDRKMQQALAQLQRDMDALREQREPPPPARPAPPVRPALQSHQMQNPSGNRHARRRARALSRKKNGHRP